MKTALLVVLLVSVSGCGVLRPKQSPDLDIATVAGGDVPASQTDEVLSSGVENWAYGQGIGETTINVATSLVFPPYAVYVLGNALISYAGYEPLYITNALPGELHQYYSAGYSTVASGPGRLTSAVAGREYIRPEVGRQRLLVAMGSSPKASS